MKTRKQVDIHYRIVLNIKTQRGPSVTVKSTYSLFSLSFFLSLSLNSEDTAPLLRRFDSIADLYYSLLLGNLSSLLSILCLFSLNIMLQIFKVPFFIHANYYNIIFTY